MIKPTIPHNEQARLQSLHGLNLLDTIPEERFDRLSRMAKKIFDTPIALVSIVDDNHQWFKSCIGLLTHETPRDISFCGHAILGDDALVVPDTHQDERFVDNPLVTGEPHIRFYAGHPIRSPDQHNLGTICVIDTKPRTIENDEIIFLKDLALMVENEIATNAMSTLDGLTHINNRRGFLSLAEKSLSFCKRKQMTSTLAFFNINQFSNINKIHGHTVGDTALITFTELLRHHLRRYDICARLGGDEFVALFMDTKENDAKLIVNKLKAVVNQFNQYGQQPYDISFSYGLVEFSPQRNQNIVDLFSNNEILKHEDEIQAVSEYLQNLSPSQQTSQSQTSRFNL